MIINIETLLDHFDIYRPEQQQILMALPLSFLPLLPKVPKSPLSHPYSLQIPHILRHVSIGEFFPDSLLMSCEDVEAVIRVNRRNFVKFDPGASTYFIGSPYSLSSLSLANSVWPSCFFSALILDLSTSAGTLAGGKI
jgi:hypothetical protein